MHFRRSLPALLLIAISSFALNCGCQNTGEEPADGELPKLTYHKPGDYETALARLNELTAIINSDEPLPAPKVFKVLEVIHTTGSSSHAHYYLVGEETPDEHGPADQKSEEKFHDYEVPVLTEFYDIVRWLPSIAGGDEMDEETWEKVNTASKDFRTTLQELEYGKSESEFRAALQAEKESVNGFLAKLPQN